MQFMHTLSRSSESLSSHVPRGVAFVAGCSPFGSQRAVAAPRSNAAGSGRRVRGTAIAREVVEGEHGLLAKVSAASRVCFASPRKPNPALKRTCLRQAA